MGSEMCIRDRHQVDRLEEDHRHAKILADGVLRSESLMLDPSEVDSNIVIFKVDPNWGTAPEFVKALADRDVRMMPFSRHHVRAVTHMHVDEPMAKHAAAVVEAVAAWDA